MSRAIDFLFVVLALALVGMNASDGKWLLAVVWAFSACVMTASFVLKCCTPKEYRS